ncbi:3-phosphoshikimate 1-carboxyvinyltransferase [Elusimicrobiota bacterium]
MMNWTINKVSKICGSISVPGDKSITHRAVILSAISSGESQIENYLPSQDCISTIKAFEKLGVRIENDGHSLKIHGVGLKGLKSYNGVINAGNSGTTARLLSGVLAGQNFTSKISGDESLSKRPMRRIIEPLELMGANIIAKDGNYLPIEIKGNSNLKAIEYLSPVSSAQVKSCVLLAALFVKGTTEFEEPIKSRDHTERMFKDRGADIKVDGNVIRINGGHDLKSKNIEIPGDISSAAFFLVAASILKNSKVTIKNVGINSTRDGIIKILEKMGLKISKDNNREISGEPVSDISVEYSPLSTVDINEDIIPSLIDEIPIIVLAATQADGRTKISGAKELKVKESDRLKSISTELNKMGANIQETQDGLIISGRTNLKGTKVKSHGDHRIAMTLAIAGLIADGKTQIEDVDCVSTSFPNFYEILEGIIK